MTKARERGTLVRPVASSDVAAVRWLARHRSFGDGTAKDRFPTLPVTAGKPVAWIAEAEHRIAGFVIGWECSGKTAHVWQARVHAQYRSCDIDQRLARAALQSAREHGCLKVVLHNMSTATWAATILEESGFMFSRRRDCDGEVCLEFYLDLYARPTASTPVNPVQRLRPGPLQHE
jgi:ribosomal protein S18 acetylase RimI-like enzyme